MKIRLREGVEWWKTIPVERFACLIDVPTGAIPLYAKSVEREINASGFIQRTFIEKVCACELCEWVRANTEVHGHTRC